MSSPSAPLLVARIGTTTLTNPHTCDPAIDLDFKPAEGEAPLSALLSAYERSRSPEDLARLPLKPGRALTLFEIHALTGPQMRVARQAPGASAYLYAFLSACRRVIRPDGAKELVTTIPGDRVMADLAWVDDVIYPLFGMEAVDEIGKVALDRSVPSPGVVRPFSLPLGLTLPR